MIDLDEMLERYRKVRPGYAAASVIHDINCLCFENQRLRNALEFIGRDVRCCSLEVATEIARKVLE